jgi:hypothetical protein
LVAQCAQQIVHAVWSLESIEWSDVMTRTLTTVAAAATIAISAIATPSTADARWRHRHGFPVAPIIGGLAAGALIGAAVAGAPRVYYGPIYYEPVYYPAPACYIRRERFWDGWRWRVRRVEIC